MDANKNSEKKLPIGYLTNGGSDGEGKRPLLLANRDVSLPNDIGNLDLSVELPKEYGKTGESKVPFDNVLQVHNAFEEDIAFVLAKLHCADEKINNLQAELRASVEKSAEINSEREEIEQIMTELEERNTMLEETLLEQKTTLDQLKEALCKEKQFSEALQMKLDQLNGNTF